MNSLDIAQEFPHQPGLIYLNHAAVGPWPLRSSLAVKAFADENAQRGAQHYPRWLTVEKHLKTHLKQLINAPSKEDIALVKNTSEGLSLLAYGVQWRRGDNIVTSNQEFPSNRIVWESLEQFGVELREADLSTGESPEQALLALIDNNTRLLTISSIQYASGLRLDLKQLGEQCRNSGIIYCVDAIQSLGAVQFDAQAIHADVVTADGHKWMLGPEGLGLFYCRPELREKLTLYQYGWHMVDPLGDYDERDWRVTPTARRFECGSPNILGAHALEAALGLLLEVGLDEVEKRVINNAAYLMQQIADNPELTLLTDSQPGRFGGIVTFFHRQQSNEALFAHLKKNGVVCALRGGGIRFSPHFYTPRNLLDESLRIVSEI